MQPSELTQRRRALALVSLATLLGLSTWFSTNAIGPALESEKSLPDSDLSLPVIAVQFGFVLTTLSIWLLPIVEDHAGWGVAFAMLAAGPLVGITAMLLLRRLPESTRMASGNR